MPASCIINKCNLISSRYPELCYYKFPQGKLGKELNKWIKAIEEGTGIKLDLKNLKVSNAFI